MQINFFFSQDSDRLDQHKKYLSSGPSLILALERENAVKKLLDLLGPCDPLSARRQSQFLWRGTFGMDTVANGLHGRFFAEYIECVGYVLNDYF